MEPQRELDKRMNGSAPEVAQEAQEAPAEEMDVERCERQPRGLDDCEGDMEEEEFDDPEPVCGAAEAAAAAPADKPAEAPVLSTKVLEELAEFIQGDFFSALRKRVLQYIDNIQLRQ